MAVKGNVEVLKTGKFLIHAMAQLDEERVINIVKWELEQGVAPYAVLENARLGMERVTELYSKGRYFLGDIIVAGEIFQSVVDLVLQMKSIEPVTGLPPIVFGTVEGDIHDIGKNIIIGVLRSKGFNVIDLGVDVSPDIFVDAVKRSGSPILCLSGLITTAYDSMRATTKLLDAEDLKGRVAVIIGGLVNEAIRCYTGADYCFTSCTGVPELCRHLLKGYSTTENIASL